MSGRQHVQEHGPQNTLSRPATYEVRGIPTQGGVALPTSDVGWYVVCCSLASDWAQGSPLQGRLRLLRGFSKGSSSATCLGSTEFTSP